ncbi:hypothetical protein PBI_BOGOSYJAY_33 [Mycobacterium phage BogosyJay]|nr:hypothetical protein PBI_MAMINIAINA_33 [Mycobacterium phage Maminiaina]QFG14941.1 hypothetical protein PBI_BOGOSYJAY_33 [Mycobacterium phage BogosyJay]
MSFPSGKARILDRVKLKPIGQMTDREKQALIRELEIEHRVAIVEAAKVKRERNRLNAELESREERIREIETGIALLR